jgi:hypothetical protein
MPIPYATCLETLLETPEHTPDSTKKPRSRIDGLLHLDVAELLGNLVQLVLCGLVLLHDLLVLLLPLVSLGLDGSNLALIVFGLNVGEAEPEGGLLAWMFT